MSNPFWSKCCDVILQSFWVSSSIYKSSILSSMDFRLFPRCALISSIAVLARVACADSNTNGTWLYPDPSTTPTFNYLDTLNASWTSDFSSPWLHLYCGIINGNSSSPVLGERMIDHQSLLPPPNRSLTSANQCTIKQPPQQAALTSPSTTPSNHSAATLSSPACQPSGWGPPTP